MTAQPPFAAVYFDCDSTLSAIEGVDELLQWADPALRAEIAALTKAAMEGKAPLATVYEQRLQRLRPRREQIDEVGALYCERSVPDAAAVVAALRHLGKHVGIISGGLLEPVRALARQLGVDEENVYAVDVRFDERGDYVDFDRASPLWQNGGKALVLQSLPGSHRPLAFVGDGATDLETQGTAADLFVGYGGVAERRTVRERAEAWFATESLAPLLGIVLTPQERRRLAKSKKFAALVQRIGAADGAGA